MRKLSFVFFLLLTTALFAQDKAEEPAKEKIASVFEKYFDLEREAIHLHVSKSTFLTSESIWFQGYVINRKTNKPYFTTNVYVTLLDDKGRKLSDQLLFASNGSFAGKINLAANYPSGLYYLHTYTNWMNNFRENESTLTKITIINPEEGVKNYSKINPNTLEILVTPEGGTMVQDVSNTIGIQVKDCRGNSPKEITANLKNEKRETIRSVKLNDFGNGKMEFTPSSEVYTVSIDYNGQTIEKKLPKASPQGIAITTNNYTFPDKTVLNIRTNEQTFKKLSDKTLYLVIHQDQKYSINAFSIPEDKLEQVIYVPVKILSPGINTIRIIDGDMKEYASRSIYIYPKRQQSISFVSKKTNYDNTKLSCKSIYSEATLSTSVMPKQSLCLDTYTNIYSGLTINPYLINPLPDASYYFNNPSKLKLYELDLALLNVSTQKYSWELMKLSPPTAKFDFDFGLTIKGKIDPTIKDKSSCKAKLVCHKNLILNTTDVSETGEYEFKNLLVPDSAYVELTLLRLPDFEKVNTILTAHVDNRKRDFLKTIDIIPASCNENVETIAFNDFGILKKYPQAILLKEVDINNKPRMRYESQVGNGNLRGFKIEGNNYLNVSLYTFLRNNGFNVDTGTGQITTMNQQRTSLNGQQSSPIVYVDGRQVYDLIQIDILQMKDIDEIFLNPYAIIPGLHNYTGMIKIYTKRLLPIRPQFEKNPNAFYIADGFAKYPRFRNNDYATLDKEAFENFGMLGWSTQNLSEKEGNFDINIKDYNTNDCKAIIEGITPEGDLLQDEIDITLKE